MGYGDGISDPTVLAGIPLEGGTPLALKVGYTINDIKNISSVDSSYDVDMYLELTWTDHRLVEHPEVVGNVASDMMKEGELWVPQLEFMNAMNPPDVTTDLYYVDGTTCSRWQRLKATCETKFDLHTFPFDIQLLTLRFESSRYDSSELLLNVDDNAKGRVAPAVRDMHFYSEWSLRNTLFQNASTYVWFCSDDEYGFVQVDLVIERQTGYYVYKIGLTGTLIWLMSLSVFVLPYDDLG